MLAIKAYVGKSKLNSANKNYIHLGLNLGTLMFHFNAFLTVLSQEGIKIERKSSLAQSSVEVMCLLKYFCYRSGTVNSNTVNSKFHLIRSCCKYLARFLSFHV